MTVITGCVFLEIEVNRALSAFTTRVTLQTVRNVV